MFEPEANLDRRVSDTLMNALSDASGLGAIVDLRNEDPGRYDVLLTKTSDGESRASLYVCLTKILDVRERRGYFWLSAHRTHGSVGGFDPRWNRRQELSELAAQRGEIIVHLRRARRAVPESYLQSEGAAQALICSGVCSGFAVITREAGPSYGSQLIKNRWTSELGQPLLTAVRSTGRTDAWWPGVRDGGKLPSLGQEADVLAVDEDGNLLVIEVKPATAAKGLAWAPVQVLFYATVFARLLATDESARDKLSGMLAQRRELGLTPPNGLELRDRASLIPVVAIGAGDVSREVLRRVPLLAAALPPQDPTKTVVAPTRVWKYDSSGDFEWQGLATEYMGD